jgi:hypothetical protein
MIGRTVSVIDWLARPTPRHDPFRGGAVALPALGRFDRNQRLRADGPRTAELSLYQLMPLSILGRRREARHQLVINV